MFRKVSQWLTDKGDQFVRGGGSQEQPMDPASSQDAQADDRPVIDPFNDGDQKYGGRQLYRSRAEQEAEAAQQAQLQAQQEAEAYQAQLQAQYQAQQEAMQQAGMYQAQQGYQQNPYQGQQEAMQQTGTYQAQQGYQQNPYQGQQEVMQQTGTYQAQQGYQQNPYQGQQETMQQNAYQGQQGYQQQMQGSNVVTFPGMQSTPDGLVYAHVEYIVQLCNRHECRKVIDYIRTNASVFLNMEMIADGSERQRCVDMLSGAAYALGCALNKISPRGVYLISSPSVRVMMDNATQKLAATPEVRGFARQAYVHENAQQQYTAQQPYAAEEEPEEPIQNGGFSSGSPTQRFQSQGAQGMSVSFGTAMAGSHTSMHRAINAQRYNAQ